MKTFITKTCFYTKKCHIFTKSKRKTYVYRDYKNY
ncbi:hypothetical protein SAMN04488128_1011780 [Chitinophaga eiseniae]|uniref:Uncharacterized protein n=1 Tax=Chitinophaga eiseniae TaxID=634771 RepID=A0A1T4NVL2_9BACT|nr:hypothetical protein SAMN04488128_1011780 [Chitinophaga eiseniae]